MENLTKLKLLFRQHIVSMSYFILPFLRALCHGDRNEMQPSSLRQAVFVGAYIKTNLHATFQPGRNCCEHFA